MPEIKLPEPLQKLWDNNLLRMAENGNVAGICRAYVMGADIEAASEEGYTVLMLAVESANELAVELLLALGAKAGREANGLYASDMAELMISDGHWAGSKGKDVLAKIEDAELGHPPDLRLALSKAGIALKLEEDVLNEYRLRKGQEPDKQPQIPSTIIERKVETQPALREKEEAILAQLSSSLTQNHKDGKSPAAFAGKKVTDYSPDGKTLQEQREATAYEDLIRKLPPDYKGRTR